MYDPDVNKRKGHIYMQDLKSLPLKELRNLWAQEWKQAPHPRIGRSMLERSLIYKNKAKELTPDQQIKLNRLIKDYRKNSSQFNKSLHQLKPGTTIIRLYNGKKHSVLVQTDGLEYNGKKYKSLSKIANTITGKRWNGWVFFGLKK